MASSPVMTTAPPTPGYAIEAFELAMLSDRDIRQIAELRNALGGERFPEDPPTPTEVAAATRARLMRRTKTPARQPSQPPSAHHRANQSTFPALRGVESPRSDF